MNKNAAKKEKAIERAREQERVKQEILFHAKELAAEMNLRLLLEQETQGEVLFVESIAVMDISYPQEQKKAGFFARMLCRIRRLAYHIIGRRRSFDRQGTQYRNGHVSATREACRKNKR